MNSGLWEYRIAHLDVGRSEDVDRAEKHLNALGADGWQAVNMSYADVWGQHTVTVLLKRDLGWTSK